jgi:formylglycine-generating enzyme required for sulfatase activity
MPSGVGELRARTPPPSSPRSILPLVAITAGAVLGVGGFLLFRPHSPPGPPPAPNANDKSGATSPTPTPTPTPTPPPEPSPSPPPESPAPAGMVAFAAGTLHMGRDDYGMPGALDVPAHDVKVGPFALARAEVTERELAEFRADAGKRTPSARELERHGDLPASAVSHEDAARYCAWRFIKGRLPTEAEWEWAARGKEGRLYPWGNKLDKRCVNGFAGERGAATEASRHTCGATPEGLVDLAGNVWEWTATPASAYPGAMVSAPPGEYFVVRGGSFYNMDPNEVTATARQFVSQPNRYLGFRCAADR